LISRIFGVIGVSPYFRNFYFVIHNLIVSAFTQVFIFRRWFVDRCHAANAEANAPPAINITGVIRASIALSFAM
jgi:hypothetical protein